MIRSLTVLAAIAAVPFTSAESAAQGMPAPPPTEPPPSSAAPAVVPAAPPPPPPSTAIASQPAPRLTLGDLTGALGFGVGVIPSAELVGTAGAVSIKYWLRDGIALAPLLSFAYDNPSDTDAAWHLRPEMLVLFVPFQGASTRFELGAGVGFQVGRAAPASVSPGNGPPATPNTTFAIALPIQAGVEHFFTRWFSMGIAARTDLFSYAQDGDFHDVSLSIDSTSLLAQLFFYTD